MKYIIPMIVGSAIGYITNWFAIKMLFRPHNEKRVLGVKVPFTPGLIPKERNRIAKSIGNAVGEHLLTPEVLVNTLSDKVSEEDMANFMVKKLDKIKEKETTIKEIIDKCNQGNSNELLQVLQSKLVDYIYNNLKKDKLKSKLITFLQGEIYDKYKEPIINILLKVLETHQDKIFSQPEIKEEIKNIINRNISLLESDERKLGEILPEPIIYNIKNLVEVNQKQLSQTVQEVFHGKEAKEKLQSSIANLVDENISRAITIFITPEIISEKIYQAIEKYIDSPETSGDIVFAINLAIDKLQEVNINTIASHILNILKEDEENQLIDYIYNLIFNELNQMKLIHIIREKLEFHDLEIKELIFTSLLKGIDLLVDSQEFKDLLDDSIGDIVGALVSKPVSYFATQISKENIFVVTNILKRLLDSFVLEQLPNIIKSFNIAKIVEDEINSFQVEFAEELILEIASKELEAITWLGALLGAIMGLLSPILQMIQL